MEAKYNAAIKAGVIGGVLLAICALINMVVGILGLIFIGAAIGCLVWLLVIVISAGTGAMAVNFAKASVTKLVDALIVSAVAGAIAGIIYAVVQIVIAFIQPFLNISSYTYSSDLGSTLGGNAISSGAGGVATCMCSPVTVIIVIILAVIGGAIWAVAKLKLK